MASARRTGTNENISTYGDGTRDYTSLSAWEAATDNDLVTAMVSEVLECFDDAVFDDSVVLAGATTDASFFRIIRPASGEGHDGTPNTGVRFAATGGPVGIFDLREHFASVQDLVMTASGSSVGLISCVVMRGTTSDQCAGVGCISHDVANTGAGTAYGFADISNAPGSFFVDCLSINNGDGGFNAANTTGTTYHYNCTAVTNTVSGFVVAATELAVVKNCLASGNATSDFSGTFEAASVTNASSDSTAPGTGSRIDQTFSFVDAGSDDYHLATSDMGAKDFGTDLSSDSVFPFNDDVDFEAFVTWDIGFDEPGDVVDGPTPGHTYQHQGLELGHLGMTRSWSA